MPDMLRKLLRVGNVGPPTAGEPEGYEEYLLALLNEEASQRHINRRKRLIHEARFPVLRTPRVRGGGFQRYPQSEQDQGTATV